MKKFKIQHYLNSAGIYSGTRYEARNKFNWLQQYSLIMNKKLIFLLLPLLSSCFKNSSHLITYEVDGTSNSYEISYTDESGDSVHLDYATNTWRQEFASDGNGTAKLKMRNRNRSGTAIGSIYCDGKLKKQQTAGASDSLEIELKY
ncbi:MAG TPA: hypothetical protein VE978_03835 [Chitinophagales bacterium]|nr:hypothetical protein [Chitinophagales bacterium]